MIVGNYDTPGGQSYAFVATQTPSPVPGFGLPGFLVVAGALMMMHSRRRSK
jgi:hypothetical protein